MSIFFPLITAIGCAPLGLPAPPSPNSGVLTLIGSSPKEALEICKILDDMLMASLKFSAGDDDMIQRIESEIVKSRANGHEKDARRWEELLVNWKRERSEMLKWQLEKFREHIKFCEEAVSCFRNIGDEKNAQKRETVLKQFKEALSKLERRKKLVEEEQLEGKVAPAPRLKLESPQTSQRK
jgi:hypothetical protein